MQSIQLALLLTFVACGTAARIQELDKVTLANFTSLVETEMDAESDPGHADACLKRGKCARYVVTAETNVEPQKAHAMVNTDGSVSVWTDLCTHTGMNGISMLVGKESRKDGWDRLKFTKSVWHATLGSRWVTEVTSKGDSYYLKHIMVATVGSGWFPKVNQGVAQADIALVDNDKMSWMHEGRGIFSWRSASERLGALSAEDLVKAFQSADEKTRVFIDLHRGNHPHTGFGGSLDHGPVQNLADVQCPSVKVNQGV